MQSKTGPAQTDKRSFHSWLVPHIGATIGRFNARPLTHKNFQISRQDIAHEIQSTAIFNTTIVGSSLTHISIFQLTHRVTSKSLAGTMASKVIIDFESIGEQIVSAIKTSLEQVIPKLAADKPKETKERARSCAGGARADSG